LINADGFRTLTNTTRVASANLEAVLSISVESEFSVSELRSSVNLRDSINADSNFVVTVRFEAGVAVVSGGPSNLNLVFVVNENLRSSN